jgi:hypothetical protein
LASGASIVSMWTSPGDFGTILFLRTRESECRPRNDRPARKVGDTHKHDDAGSTGRLAAVEEPAPEQERHTRRAERSGG